MAALAPNERRLIRSRIAMALCNLPEFRVYWLPGHRMVACRSLSVRRRFRLPPGAVELGVYSHDGTTAPEIVRDLEELIARLPRAE